MIETAISAVYLIFAVIFCGIACVFAALMCGLVWNIYEIFRYWATSHGYPITDISRIFSRKQKS